MVGNILNFQSELSSGYWSFPFEGLTVLIDLPSKEIANKILNNQKFGK